MLKKLMLAVAALVALFLAYVAWLPADGRIERTATLAATPAALFAHVNDFHKWQAWSPWAKLDASAKATYEGPETGVGAAFAWDGNADVGAGKMTIVESTPAERIVMRLDFTRPMANTSLAEFTFTPEGDKTRVTWSMRGEASFFQRAVCTLLNADKMVGDMFEAGLKSLEGAAKAG